MDNQYVDITPELLGKPDPDQQWIERELNRINPWRHEQGADGADTAALRQLVLELRDKGRSDAQPDNSGPAFPAFEVRTHDTGDLVANASQGMTVRDYFAAKALQGLVVTEANQSLKPDAWAQEAYMVADAMLKARVA